MVAVVRMFLVALLCALGACSCPHAKGPATGSVVGDFGGAPPWVLLGCVHTQDKVDASGFCGVGSAQVVGDIEEAKEEAVVSARANLLGNWHSELRGYVQYPKFKDLMQSLAEEDSTGDAKEKPPTDNQVLEEEAIEAACHTLGGTPAVTAWLSKTGTLWVMVKLDVADLEKALSGTPVQFKRNDQAILERAERAFRELDGETTPELSPEVKMCKRALARQKLDEAVRRAIVERAEKAFRELQKAEESSKKDTAE
jgi:hypothetical protein